jgi:hypothetical protein
MHAFDGKNVWLCQTKISESRMWDSAILSGLK